MTRRLASLVVLGGLLGAAGCDSDDDPKRDAAVDAASGTPDGGAAGTGGGAGGGGSGGAGSGGAGSGGGGAGAAGTGGAVDAARDGAPADGGVGTDAARDAAVGGTDGGAGDRTSVTSDAAPRDGVMPATMSFFVTSRGIGNGGNFGGITGADAHCRALAREVNSPKTMWFAYLSVMDGGNGMPTHARTRIGSGPWFNAFGVKIADSVPHLHQNAGMDNAIRYETNVDERGNAVPGRDNMTRPMGAMNDHDIVTGSTVDGMVYAGRTCNDWTSSASMGVIAQVGHSDKDGPMNRIEWNSAHETSGCAEGRMGGGIGSGGGSGRFYCFAAD